MSTPHPPPPHGEAAHALSDAPLDPTLDWYGILSLDSSVGDSASQKLGPQSSLKELKTAYRRKAKDLHPDKNPDPKAAVLFHQLQRVFESLSDPLKRAAYDARIEAARVRATKDAQLDAALSTMKKDLLRREAEAAAKKIELAAIARQAALNPRGTKTPLELSREANENMIREMMAARQQKQQQQQQQKAKEDVMALERPSKARRTQAGDGSVHAGAQEQKEASTASTSSGNENTRTLVIRWPRTTSPTSSSSSSSSILPTPPTSAALHSLLHRFGTIEHIFLRPEKRKAMIVFATQSAARQACLDVTLELPLEWEVKLMERPSESSTASSSSAVSITDSTTPAATSATNDPSSSIPSFEFGVGPSAELSFEDYEAATLKRLAKVAKAKKEAAAAIAAATATQ